MNYFQNFFAGKYCETATPLDNDVLSYSNRLDSNNMSALSADISSSEVTDALNTMNANSAPGYLAINVATLKVLCNNVTLL